MNFKYMKLNRRNFSKDQESLWIRVEHLLIMVGLYHADYLKSVDEVKQWFALGGSEQTSFKEK